MIVIADTTPINYLLLIESIEILEKLYRHLLIPQAVHEELTRQKAPPTVRAWAENLPPWIQIVSPTLWTDSSADPLDRGESQAIALAIELRAHRLLMDDLAGREEAAKQGLRTIGTLGILRDAHRVGFIDARETLPRLRAAGFFITDALIQSMLDSL